MPTNSPAIAAIAIALRATRAEFDHPFAFHSEQDVAEIVCTYLAHRLADELIQIHPAMNRRRFLSMCGCA